MTLSESIHAISDGNAAAMVILLGMAILIAIACVKNKQEGRR